MMLTPRPLFTRRAPAAGLALPLALALALLGSAASAAPSAAATETLACPDLTSATQVDACPTEDQLQLGFTGYCSDNRRLYASDHDTCTRFENYRKLKNVALWEAGADGAFQGYLSCEVPRERLVAARVQAVSVSRQGSVTRVACTYGEGLTLALRTKARCTVQADARCAADAAHCRVRCD